MSEQTTVRIWAENITLPTYLAGEPNRNPMFLEKRVYQGSSGRVYPYPVIDRICDTAVEENHRVVFLENKYLKLMVMPGFGGRIQYAYDKTNGYPFIYHNRVIKPALVGLAGPWLSGGIEFNWPQHHRPSTYCPVDYTITRNPDRSMTLWLSEIEPMWHLKGTLGLTLHPGRALLEINIRLFNPTPLPQSFHLWTNPAVHVNDQYQSVFPPDVHAVYDHGKRDVSAFPIARGHYYKVDYSKGVDISWYKNLPVPTSYMAAQSDYDFIGGYDHGRQAGILHVADHHFVPGKKQWVWGCGDFGRAWDRNLTDTDGPYAELMCGVFADNQPDFSWLQPLEEKQVKQFFLPYKAIGCVRNATIHAAVSLDLAPGEAKVGAYASASRPRASLRLCYKGKPIWNQVANLAPQKPLVTQAAIPKGIKPHHLRLEIRSAEGELLVAYTPERKQAEAIPDPAKPIPSPSRVTGTEALYLAGLHLEQYRHATREPEDYYREALRRAPGDLRNNNALGLLLLRRGQFAQAEPFFRTAIQTQTCHNPNPQDGEPHYNLGLCLRYLGQPDAACAAFSKAAWDGAQQDAAFAQLAQLASGRGEFGNALEFIDRALGRNALNQKATHLKMVLLRKLGRSQEARRLAESALARDPLDFGARNELAKLLGHGTDEAEREMVTLTAAMHGNVHTYLEIAADYASAGFYEEAIDLLERAVVDENRSLPERPQDVLRCADSLAPRGTSGERVRERGILLPTPQSSPRREGASSPRPSPPLGGGEGEALSRQREMLRKCVVNPSVREELPVPRGPGHVAEPGMPNSRPMLFYFLGYYASLKGDQRAAEKYFHQAARQNPERCFPNSLESILALQAALRFNPRDARASFYLGNLWYDKRQVADATACWEAAARFERALPTVHRNLALLYFNKQQAPAKALRSMERAFALDPGDARVLFELDLLKKRLLVPPGKRLAFLSRHRKTVNQREDLVLELITLLNFFGRHEEALELLLLRQFHPWEGGEGKVTGQYVVSLVELAKQRLSASARKKLAAGDAVALLDRARTYPHNLGEGKLNGAKENAILYWLGVAWERLGEPANATACWQEAATGLRVPASAVYYNDPDTESIFYQGLALGKLGRLAAARERFLTLLRFGRKHLHDHVVMDYFAVSLPEFTVFDGDLDARNQINCRHLRALGYFGLGRRTQALLEWRQALKLDPSHLSAKLHLRLRGEARSGLLPSSHPIKLRPRPLRS